MTFRSAFALLALAGCASLHPHQDTSTSPGPATPWTPPASAVPAPRPTETQMTLPPSYKPGMTLTLADVVDIALANNSATRSAWLRARAAQAAVGSAEAAYLPQIDGTLSVTRQRAASTGANATQTIIGPSISLDWLLFDFGGREAAVTEARQTLIALDFEHNQAIQDVILRAQQAYYSYLDAKALLDAQNATIKERQLGLDAADARHNAGVATIADVLQARTALSQAQLNRETIEGQRRTIEGQLATTMGLPATTTFDFGQLPLDVPAQQVSEQVDALIARATAQRPDLAAARADAERAVARVREVRAQGLPTVGVSSNIGQTWLNGNGVTPYGASIGVRVPIFTGFRNTYDIRQAELEAELANETVRALGQQIDLQVWTSYFALQTATQRLGTAKDLLASAQQSADVAAGRYRSGVGSILDLLTAESALESARAQEVQARTDWFLSVAQLAHDTGSLGVTNR